MADLVTSVWFDHGQDSKAAALTPLRFPIAILSEKVYVYP